jgi:hypothetical protein
MINDIFNAFFQVVPYGFFESVMALVVIVEFFYTLIAEPLDTL